MKRILIALALMLGFAGMATAQTAKKKAPAAVALEKAEPGAKTKKKLKKDGTPDKRFKENKVTGEVHLKKDGTPDKRYRRKANAKA